MLFGLSKSYIENNFRKKNSLSPTYKALKYELIQLLQCVM